VKLARGGKPKKDKKTAGRQRLQPTRWQAPPSFSYHAQRAERAEVGGRQQPSLAQKRSRLLSLQFWARRSGLLLAVFIALVCLVSILSLSTKPRIVLLTGDAGSSAFHSPDEYQQAASKHLSASFWNKNKITADTGAAGAALKRQYPELDNVTITLPLMGHRPIYYLRAASPAFVLQAVNGTYVLDSNGKALLTKDAASPTTVASLPIIADQTGLHAQLGKQAISSQEAQFISSVVSILAARQVAIDSLTLPAGAAQELDVRVAGKPYVIKFDMHDTQRARQQAGTYLATANNLSAQNVTPGQYIDVRVPGRAYYQ